MDVKERIVDYMILPDGRIIVKKARGSAYPNLSRLFEENEITLSILSKELHLDGYFVEEKIKGMIYWDIREMNVIKKLLGTQLSLDELFCSTLPFE